jgi:hypothetical protein
LIDKAFFSFTSVAAGHHQDYNRWHQLDHRPENLALPGVIWGERWVLSPDCVAAGVERLAPVDDMHYVNLYWFRDPVEQSFREWQALAERSFQWGRRPDLHYAQRAMMGSFTPVKGYVNPRVLVGPDVLMFRPNRGIEVTLTQLHEPHSPQTQDLLQWQDEVQLPALLGCHGVAGAWTFSSQSTTMDAAFEAAPGSTTFDQAGAGELGRFRVTVVFLDEDPLAYLEDKRTRLGSVQPADRGLDEAAALTTTLFSGVLRTIVPWEWDWFD